MRTTGALLEDSSEAHIALLQDPGVATVAAGTIVQRKPSFHDLLVPLVTTSREENGDLVWESVPCLGGGTGDSELVTLHRAHQRALARHGGASADAVPSVHVILDGDAQARIRAAHRRADWVIGIDKFVGVNLFESGLSDPFILDYAPDFVEGIGDRLTVTTTHRDEVEFLLAGAMSDLGLDDVESSVGSVLQTLAVVSGRLALRLLENTTQAREAVSLAALMGHLKSRGELENTIVVPVDAHPEIFGAAAHDEGAARRCDLLLVRVGQRSFKIECVEVKSRKEAQVAQTLADTIIEQLQVTKQVLESRFFSDPPRIDAELQMARLTSLLHYYADRAATHGLISLEKLEEIHRYIDRVEEKGERAEISMTGWVISLDGAQGFKKQYGDIPLRVLTAHDLGQIGLSTRARLEPSQGPETPPLPSPVARESEPLPLAPVPDPSPIGGVRVGARRAGDGEVEAAAGRSRADESGTRCESPPTPATLRSTDSRPSPRRPVAGTTSRRNQPGGGRHPRQRPRRVAGALASEHQGKSSRVRHRHPRAGQVGHDAQGDP